MISGKGKIIFLTMLAFAMIACHRTKEDHQKQESLAVPVSVIKAQVKTIDIKFRSVGSLMSRKSPIVKSLATGNVEKIEVYEGEQVKAGETLAKLTKEHEVLALNSAKANYYKAEAVFNERKVMARRKSELVDRGIVSRSDYDEAEASLKVAHAQLEIAQQNLTRAELQFYRTKVSSPIDGQVEKIMVSEGEFVSPGTPMFKLINHEKLSARLPFSEEKASRLQKGQKAHLTSPTDPDHVLEARVTSITPSINPASRAINVIVEFENKAGWKAGSSIHGQVFSEEKFKAIIVSPHSVILRSNGLVVFIVKDGKAYEKAVKIGYETPEFVAVVKGLSAGDQVVSHGAAYLSNGTPVSITANSGE